MARNEKDTHNFTEKRIGRKLAIIQNRKKQLEIIKLFGKIDFDESYCYKQSRKIETEL